MQVTTSSRRRVDGECPYCGRTLALTFHHLVPEKMHRRRRFRRLFKRAELAQGIYLCRDCHDGIHKTYSEMELAERFATPEALAEDEQLARHFRWLSRQQRR